MKQLKHIMILILPHKKLSEREKKTRLEEKQKILMKGSTGLD